MDHLCAAQKGGGDGSGVASLPADERASFEEHFIDCRECLDRVEIAGRWRGAMKAAVAEGPLAQPARWRLMTLLAAACLLAVAAPLLFWRELGKTRADLDSARKASSEWQRRYQEAPGARAETSALPATLPVFPLTLTRDAATEPSGPAVRIVVPAAAPWVVFSLDQGGDPGLLSYRATISRGQDQVVWTAADLKPSPSGGLAIAIQLKILQPGDHVLILEGATSRGG